MEYEHASSSYVASYLEKKIPIVTERFQEAHSVATNAAVQAQSALNDLQTYLLGLAPTELFPVFNLPDFTRYTLATGEKPVAPTLSFPDLTIPDVDVPIPGFYYSDSPYASELRESLKEKLQDLVDNGGSGLGAGVEDAIYSRNELRDEQALQDRLDGIDDDWSESNAGDLGLPTGALLTAKRRVHQEYLAGRQTASKDIATNMANLARQQQEVALKTGTELENVMEQKHSADQLRLLEAAKVEPEIVIKAIEAAIMKVKAATEVYNALAAKANAQAKVFETQMSGYLADVEVGSKEILASTEIHKANTQAAQAESEAHWRTDSNKIEQIKNYLSLRVQAMQAILQVFTNLEAAAMTSVSATASLGASVQATENENDTYAVYHNYEHKDDREFM